MPADLSTRLRIERSMNCSGALFHEKRIGEIRNKDYYVDSVPLDGDAPKQFIRVYHYAADSGIYRRSLQT
ncbi:hypothetical protein, partial [Mucilaginibacter sp.]